MSPSKDLRVVAGSVYAHGSPVLQNNAVKDALYGACTL